MTLGAMKAVGNTTHHKVKYGSNQVLMSVQGTEEGHTSSRIIKISLEMTASPTKVLSNM